MRPRVSDVQEEEEGDSGEGSAPEEDKPPRLVVSHSWSNIAQAAERSGSGPGEQERSVQRLDSSPASHAPRCAPGTAQPLA